MTMMRQKSTLTKRMLLLSFSFLLCSFPAVSAKKCKNECPKDFTFATPVPKDDSCRVIESGFGVDRCGFPVKGKNVLIIGGSRGIGRACAQAFAAAGAHVISTSRHPECYFPPFPCNPAVGGVASGIPASPGLSTFPLELADAASIISFFKNAIFPVWDHIDIIILCGIKVPLGALATSQASDLFEFANVQLFGFHRVINQAFPLIANVDNSRIIMTTSSTAILPLPFLAPYNIIKAALVQWVKEWNMERLIHQKMSGGKPFYKTTAISFEGSFVKSGVFTNGEITTLPITFEGGVCCPWDFASNPQHLGLVAHTGSTTENGMPVERAAQAILWMSTTKDPEWRYAVFAEGEKYCLLPGCKPVPAIDFLSKFNAYKLKKPFTDWVDSLPLITIAKHPFDSTWFDCVAPTDEVPALPAPAILPGTCCAEPAKESQAHTRPEYVEDLVHNGCKRLPYDNDFTQPPATCPVE